MGHPAYGFHLMYGPPARPPKMEQPDSRCRPPDPLVPQRSKNLSFNSSLAPSNPGNKEPAVMPIMLNSRMTVGLSLTGRSMILKKRRSALSNERMYVSMSSTLVRVEIDC